MAGSVSITVDAKRLKQDVNAILEKKCKAITKNNALYRDIGELYAEKTQNYVPMKTGNLFGSVNVRYSNRQIVQDTSAIDKYGRDYFEAQYWGDNGSGVPASKWKRANAWGHKGQVQWLSFVHRNAIAWRSFVKECAEIIQSYFDRGEI